MKPALALSPQLTQQPDMRIVIVGHVDHGKSTLVGRLLYDTDSLPDGKYEQIKASCDKRAMPFEFSFLMDALQAERDQNVTIDTTQIWFSSALRRYCIIDAPGHREFLKNMITGAASADAALLLIDAEEGVKEQSKRHGYLLHLLGIRQVAVIINKMDLVGYSEARYQELVAEYGVYLRELGVEPAAFVPVSARQGDHITAASAHMPWYKGASVLGALDGFAAQAASDNQPLRFTVQDVYRFDARRIIAGRIESGVLKVGDSIVFSPSNLHSRVRSLEQWPESRSAKLSAEAGESVGITLEDQIFVERGQVGSHEDHAPMLTNIIHARLFWLHDTPLKPGMRYTLKLGTASYKAEIKQITQVLDTDSLKSAQAEQVSMHQVAEVVLRIRGMAVVDDYQDLPKMGRFVLFDQYDVAGGGIISTDEVADLRESQRQVKSGNLTRVDFEIDAAQRAQLNGHKGGVLWFTGLSGSGKSTLAKELQKRLFAKGYQVYVLDGDNVRQGLCSDLGFSHEDRSENIRRVGEVASLFADAGVIVITAFISPYIEDRRRARAAASDYFNTIYIKADVQTCAGRDAKGLYKKALAGEIADFTGVSAPYEEPESPDLIVDTQHSPLEACIQQLMDYVEGNFSLNNR